MNTIISFEIAKLLKEKAFNQMCNEIYAYGSGNTPIANLAELDNNNDRGYLLAPTIAEVVMWLYDKHCIWINVSMGNKGFNCAIDYKGFKASEFILCYHPTTNEAYESAIKYVLTNLI